jgi:hypothetical protein
MKSFGQPRPEMKPNRIDVAVNCWKSFMILYYRAVNRSSNDPQDWYDAVRNAKAFEFYIRRQMPLWQAICWLIKIRSFKDSQFRDES